MYRRSKASANRNLNSSTSDTEISNAKPLQTSQTELSASRVTSACKQANQRLTHLSQTDAGIGKHQPSTQLSEKDEKHCSVPVFSDMQNEPPEDRIYQPVDLMPPSIGTDNQTMEEESQSHSELNINRQTLLSKQREHIRLHSDGPDQSLMQNKQVSHRLFHTPPQMRGLGSTPPQMPGLVHIPPQMPGLVHIPPQMPGVVHIPPQMPGLVHTPPQMPGLVHTPPQMPGLVHTPTQMLGLVHMPPQMPGLSHTPPQMPGLGHTSPQMPGLGHTPPQMIHTPPQMIYTPPQMPGLVHTPAQMPGSVHIPPQMPGLVHTPAQMPGLVHTPPRMPGLVHTPPQMSGLVNTPPQMPGLVHIPPRMPGLVHSPPQMPGLVDTPPQMPGLGNTPPQMPGLVYTPPQMPGLVHIPPQMPGLVHTPPQMPGLGNTPPRMPGLVHSPPHMPGLVHIPPRGGVSEVPVPSLPLAPPSLSPQPPPAPPPPPLIIEGASTGVTSVPLPLPKNSFLQPLKETVQEKQRLQFDPNDLLNQKRMLKKVDRMAEYNPVTLARKELFEDEYTKLGDTPPEYLPLHIVKPMIVSQNISADLVTLNLNGIDQLTDYLFPLLHGGGSAPLGNYSQLKKILLVGCVNLTDQGLIWIARLFSDLQMVEINGCRKVTEKGLHFIFVGCRNLQNVAAMAVNAALIPDSIMQTKLPVGSFQWTGCPIITQGKEYYKACNAGTDPESYFDPHKRKLLILRDKSVKEGIIPLLTKDNENSNPLFCYRQSFSVAGDDSQSFFNIFEVAADSPVQDTLVSEGSIVMIPYSTAEDSSHIAETAERIANTIAAIVTKCPDVTFLLVEIAVNSSKSILWELIRSHLEHLANALYTATYKLYTRTWHLEYLDYRGQHGLGWGITSLEALENLLKTEDNRIRTVCVTMENFSIEVTKSLSKCAVDVKNLVPWVHCEWSKELHKVIEKIPKVAVRSQMSILHETDMEARTHHHKRYSFQRLGKVINLLQNWGDALYLWHEHKSLCITDIQAYGSLLVKMLCQPPDKVRVTFLGGEIPCWRLSTIESVIHLDSLELKACDIISVLKRQGMLLSIPGHHTEDWTSLSQVFIRTDDIPDYHEILETLWPEPCPKQSILQTDRCYNFLPTLPPSFMPTLLRTLVKVYQPLYVWKTGFLLRQGPVDIKACLYKYKGSSFDKTPVLVISARIVALQKDADNTASLDAKNSYTDPKNVMFSCLKQVLTLVDFVCQKTKVYACITLPCPECTESFTEGIINTGENWHLQYYIGLAGRHKSCKTHKTVTASVLCNLSDDKGEAHESIIPIHNYPYHIAASSIIEETQKAESYRPVDPTERCFYCGGSADIPCHHCLMCSHCTKQFAKFVKTVEPSQVTSKSFKLLILKDGELTDDKRIISNTKGCVYYNKKGHRMLLHQAMVPFYWDEIFITVLRGANFFLTMTFGPGKKLEYHNHAATVVDQTGQAHVNELWKSRDTNLMSIRLQAVEIGKRVRVVFCLREMEVHSEEVDGWQMKLDINSEKAGVYIIHMPGMKADWYMHEHSFPVGSTLEVAENEYTSHPAIILEKTSEGYLTLDVNGVQRQYIFNSPQLIPTGSTAAMGSTLASTLPTELQDGKSVCRAAVPLWAFMKVPCGFEALIKASISQSSTHAHEGDRNGRGKDLKSLIYPCTGMDFPSVWHGKQVLLRDDVEKSLFTDGKWNFSLAALLMLPNTLTRNDFTICSQSVFTHNFRLHPFCYFRGDVNTVMSSGPTVPQFKTLECFHSVHMLDNLGFELGSFSFDEPVNLGLNILWAWTLMLLRLQHIELQQIKTLTREIQGTEELSAHQICEGYRQVIQAMNQALFLRLGKDFDFTSSLNDYALERWKDLMLEHGATQSLIKVKPLYLDDTILMCESHQASWQVNMGHERFTGVPGLYGYFVYSLNLSGNSLGELQAELFESMPNLKDLNLSCNKLVSLPSEICKCVQLTTLSLGENLLKVLPSTLEHCKDIFRLDIDKNNFDEFPAVICKLKKLKRLYAQFLHLQSLPVNIGDLSELETLSLSGNCFTSLPESMSKLQNLVNLSLNGVMWMKSRNNILLSKEHFAEFLKINNLHQWLDRHKKDKSAIFSLFDEDTNGTLDQKEIGKLNATLFHVFPRLGYMGKEPPNDDTASGFPGVLCELKSLQYLSLQYHGIVAIPEIIRKMTKLHTLHLGNNPNLLAISAHAGSLPLKRLELEGCPRLKTPPKEIIVKGFTATLAYLKRLLSGSVSCQRTKLMLVGLGGAGKSSLVKALLSQSKMVQPTAEEEITDGIDICPWTVPTKEGDITYSVWDFAGQTVYYNTHQFFLSDRAVYLLVWNIRLGHEHAGLAFWLSSITVHAPKAPIFVVGTHIDQVSKIELPMREMRAKYSQICGFHFVSSRSGQGVTDLQEQLIEVTLKQQYMGENIPGVWLNFEDSIKSIQNKSVIEYKEVESRANKSGIFERTEVIQAVQFLHELGALQHFTSANLKSHVVINPQWLVNVMACVVSVKDSAIKDGRLYHSDVALVWKDYDPALHRWMLKLTEEFDLTFPLKDEEVNLVPCLLPEKQPEFEWPEADRNGCNRETRIMYTFDYLPAGLFNRAQVRLHQFCDSSMIWKRGSYLKKNGHVCLIHQSKESELIVKAFGPRPDNIVLLVHEVIETLIMESFRGITYDFHMPCPDCLKVAVRDPHMFAVSTIRRATELKTPFLQCLKYFHITSVTELHAIMPPDSNQDFDLHLVRAVRGMKELQQDLTAEVFVSYCPMDTEIKHDETVIPTRVLEDIEKLGYKCWRSQISSIPSSTDEMARALIDAKIFMVFMSNNYVLDQACCNLFKYARLTLHKPLVLVAIGENLNWKESNMGILMADEVFVNFMKASRYNDKFEELEAMMKNKHMVKKIDSGNKIVPPCFISYCWQNSAQAVAKGSKSSEGAVGYGDPRAIKDFLETQGIKCWIDVERVGIVSIHDAEHGLFEDIGEGLINCQVMVVCVSDQYAASDNCLREFRYAANTLKLPIVLAVVGTGNKWRASELGIMSLNYPLVSFQEQSNSAMDKLFDLIHNLIQSERKTLKKGTDSVKNNDRENLSTEEEQKLSFQELCELVQRKFLRQVTQYADRLDPMPYPNVILVDFWMEETGQMEMSTHLTSKKSILPGSENMVGPTVQRIRDRSATFNSANAGDFHDQRFCAHLLCEHEEGWHTTGSCIVLDNDFGHTIEQFLPYIARITAIAKYSKKLVLNCLSSHHGEAFLKWMEKNPSVAVNTDFQDSYGILRQVVQNADTDRSMGRLERCLLPSGKYIWLCEAHRSSMRVTVLEKESQITTVHRQSETMGVDYMLQALQELDVDLLPQQLNNAHKAAINKNKTSTIIKSNFDTDLRLSDSTSAVSTRKESTLLNEKSSSQAVVGQNGSPEKDQIELDQQKSASQSHTTSRACILM